MKDKKAVINDENLEPVTGGDAPSLPANTLGPGGYNGMVSGSPAIAAKEFHFYDGKVIDPSYFITDKEIK